MNPPLLFAANWLSSPYVFWSIIALCVVAAIAIAVFIFRKRRAAAFALIRHPFSKYVILSVVVHVGLVAWLLTSHFFDVPDLSPGSAMVIVDVGSNEVPSMEESQPWDNPNTELAEGPVPNLPAEEPKLPEIERPETTPAPNTQVESPLADLESVVEKLPVEVSPFSDAPKPPAESALLATSNVESEQTLPEQTPEPTFSPNDSQQTAELNEQPNTNDDANAIASDTDTPSETDVAAAEELPSFDQTPNDPFELPVQTQTPPKAKLQPSLQQVSASPRTRQITSQTQRRSDGQQLPAIYRDRWAQDRLKIARVRGGSEETEAAVRAALVWLEQAQASDGRWDASQFGSGRPVREGGHNRGQAGLNADTATTGLAVLAFLGAGHTHVDGKYAETVRGGVDYLIRAQKSRNDGSLVGNASGYAAMYCHGIATLAISEAYSLSGDESLRQSVRRAIDFSISAQHPSGGWRYRPQESGDTSQLGWQMMALTSAHYGGHQIPASAWTRASGFLDSVAWGPNGGLASYIPNSRPSRTMTAEAMLCRLFLNTPTDHPMMQEAADHLLQELPGRGRLNYYYWYYGTLGLYHLQDENWRTWNNAVTRELTRLQSDDGSWPAANSVWGNAGGQVYTTALGAMTLEVYYRYRPLADTQVDKTARRWRSSGER